MSEVIAQRWVQIARVEDFPRNAGACVKVGEQQVAVYNFTSRGEWYACQNMCPHKRDMVLARGLIGDQAGTPKVACPQHKKTFSLHDGHCLGGEAYHIKTYPVKVDKGFVYIGGDI